MCNVSSVRKIASIIPTKEKKENLFNNLPSDMLKLNTKKCWEVQTGYRRLPHM